VQGYLELNGHAVKQGGCKVEMHLQLLFGNSACVHGYLYTRPAHDIRDAVEGEGGVEVKGTWNTMGQLEIAITGDCAAHATSEAGTSIYGGVVYRGVVIHGEEESSVRGTYGESSLDDSVIECVEQVSESLEIGEFLWHFGSRGAQQRHQWQDGAVLRTSGRGLMYLLSQCHPRGARRGVLTRPRRCAPVGSDFKFLFLRITFFRSLFKKN